MKVLRFSHYVPAESSGPQPSAPQDTPVSLPVQQVPIVVQAPPLSSSSLPVASAPQDAFTPQVLPVAPTVPVSALKFGQAGPKSLIQKAIERIFSS